MAHKFSELKAKMSPEFLASAEALYQKMLAEMPPHELDRLRRLSRADDEVKKDDD